MKCVAQRMVYGESDFQMALGSECWEWLKEDITKRLPQVWICFFGVILLTWVMLFVLLSPYGSTQKEQGKSYILWIFRTLASQSNPWLPESGPRRVLTATWLLACVIFLSLFSGTLTAMLTVPLVRVPIDSIEELVDQREIPWAIESGSFLYQILYQATSGLYKALWDGHSATITDCYTFKQDIGEGKYAAVCDKMTMKKVMSEDYSTTGECNYYMAREDFKSMPLALAFQHRHPLYAETNLQILELINKGLVDRWIEQQLPNGTSCLGPLGSNLAGVRRPLSLQDYYGLFSVYTACVVVWSMVLLSEVFIKKFNQRSAQKHVTSPLY